MLIIILLLYPPISQLAPINIEQSFLFDICEISEIIHGRPRLRGIRIPGEAGAVITVKSKQSDICHMQLVKNF